LFWLAGWNHRFGEMIRKTVRFARDQRHTACGWETIFIDPFLRVNLNI
jgi:hypothetical protein